MSQNKPPEAGKSSFDLVNPEAVFQALGLTGSMVFLDLGCGPGDYLLAAAKLIGTKGKLYGVDAWEEGVINSEEDLRKRLQQCTGLTIGRDKKRALPTAPWTSVLWAPCCPQLARDGGEQGALRRLRGYSNLEASSGSWNLKRLKGHRTTYPSGSSPREEVGL